LRPSFPFNGAEGGTGKGLVRPRENGLEQPWVGNIWFNPPYKRGVIERFVEKLICEFAEISQAVVLVDNRTDTQWFHDFARVSSVIAFTRGRIGFYTGTARQPREGQ
jgi:DNA N-6-adenine-methyltransferase (Dam)